MLTLVYKKESIKIQCGWEDLCKCKSCLNCKRYVYLTNKKISLAIATSIEDFGTVDLDSWGKEHPNQRALQQDVMCKMMKKIIWEKKGRWKRKLMAIFQF